LRRNEGNARASAYRGTSLIRNRGTSRIRNRRTSFIRNGAPIGPYSKTMPRALWWPLRRNEGNARASA